MATTHTKYKTVSSVTSSDPVTLDVWRYPFEVTVAVVLNPGVLTYTVQYTLDNIQDKDQVITWIDSVDLADETTSGVTTLRGPVYAVRLNVTIYTSGTAELKVLQAPKA